MQVGAAVAVLVVSLAIPLLRGQLVAHPKPPAAPPGETTVPRGPFLQDMDFADAEHWYAMRLTCDSGRLACTEELVSTEDGTHWQSRPVPKPHEVPSWSRGALETLGPEEVMVEWGVSPALADGKIYRIHSLDGGRTWQRVTLPTVVTATVPAIPDGASLVWTCARLADGGQKCAEQGFAVVLPGSGESALLANRPRLTAMMAGDVPTADGRWWVAGRDPKTNAWDLAISDDDGRTWTTTPLNWKGSVNALGWSVVSANGTLYATAIGALPNVSNGLLGIFRSTDGGHTWQQTWQPADGRQPRRVYWSTVAGEDGTLTINTPEGDTFSSRDGGRTFTDVKRRYGDYGLRTRIGYVAVMTNSNRTVEVSEDGVHWRKIKVG
jgi:photosystem II stability/assembly factor-like uncharacterized protein